MYVGLGMICPYIVSYSVLVGAILSSGFIIPLLEHKKGRWYPADVEEDSLDGIGGYQVSFCFFKRKDNW